MAVQPVYGDDYYTRASKLIMLPDLYKPDDNNSIGEVVARTGDVILDFNTTWYEVTDVATNGKATYIPWTPKVDEGLFNNTLIGNGNTSFRAYVDYSLYPNNEFAIDSLLKYHGSDHSYIKVFLGNDISDTGEVISAYYNQSGNLVGENIPMELVDTEDLNNVAVYAPRVGSLKRPIQSQSLITVVAYGDSGVVRSVNTLLLVEKSFVRRTEASQRQVVNIELKSSFVSPSDDRLIRWPTNATLDSSHLMARVTYTDRTLDLPANGGKFFLSGFEHYVPGREGQSVPLVLHYILGPDEICNTADTSINFDGFEGKTLFKNYQLETVQGNDAYSVTLFAAPRWIDVVSGYRMQYWLFNKKRDEFRDVTSAVTQKLGSAPFEPLLYGVVQMLEVELDLSDVSPAYSEWRWVQKIFVNLQRRGDLLTKPNWLIQYQQGQTPAYGVDLSADLTFVNGTIWDVNVTCGQTEVEDWLQRTYYASKPIFDPINEVGPVEPTHFIVHINSQQYERELAQWNVAFETNQNIQQGGLVGLRFIRRTNDGDLQLAYAALPVHRY